MYLSRTPGIAQFARRQIDAIGRHAVLPVEMCVTAPFYVDRMGPEVLRGDAQLRKLLAMIGVAYDVAVNFVELFVLRAALENFGLPV